MPTEATPADTRDIITSAIDDAGLDMGDDPGEGGGEATPDATTSSVATESALEPVADSPASQAQIDAIAQELDALGIKAPAEGQRENRLPYSRIKKIFENAKKKWDETEAPARKEYQDKLTAAQRRIQAIDAAERLAANDPDRFMDHLASINPDFKAYRREAAAAAAQPTRAAADDPKPKPNAKFPDGSTGYDDEGLDALMAWNRREAKREAKGEIAADFEKRYGPMEKAYQSQQLIADRVPIVKAQMAQLREVWGEDLLKTHDREIATLLRENEDMDVGTAASIVLTPKLKEQGTANRTKMRQELLDELKRRPAAAERTTPGTGFATGEDGPRSTEDVIRAAIAAAGLK